jgi:hypothetical protein
LEDVNRDYKTLKIFHSNLPMREYFTPKE